MPSPGGQPICAHCGVVIGIYEPILVEIGRDLPIRTSLLAIGAEEQRRAASYWHEACAAAAAL